MAKDRVKLDVLANLKQVDTQHISKQDEKETSPKTAAKVHLRQMQKFTKTIHIPSAWRENIEEHMLNSGGIGTLSAFITAAIREKMIKDGISIE